jgi:ribosomal protein S18 acetylase RimI-like enzyme
VFVSSWRHSYQGVVPEATLGDLDENEIATWLRTLVGSSDSSTTVAESNDEILGFCRYGEDPDKPGRGHIFSLYVAPRASGRGLGRRLLSHALDELAKQGLDPVTLWVFEKNERAQQLYASYGFSPDGGRLVEAEYGAEEIGLCRVSGSTE